MLFLLSLLFSSALVWSQQHPPLEVALSEVEPFAYKSKKTVKGINYQLMNELSKKSGLKFNYTLYPHMRLASALEDAGPDLAIMSSLACNKQKSYEASSGLYTLKALLYLKKPYELTKKDLRVGRILGTCGKISENLLPPQMITELSDMGQGIEMLRAGRLDGVCGLKPVVESSLKRRRTLPEKLVPHNIEVNTLEAVICRKKNLSMTIKAKLDSGIKLLKPPKLN